MKRGAAPEREWQSPCLGGGGEIERWKTMERLMRDQNRTKYPSKEDDPKENSEKGKERFRRGSGICDVQTNVARSTPAPKN